MRWKGGYSQKKRDDNSKPTRKSTDLIQNHQGKTARVLPVSEVQVPNGGKVCEWTEKP